MKRCKTVYLKDKKRKTWGKGKTKKLKMKEDNICEHEGSY